MGHHYESQQLLTFHRNYQFLNLEGTGRFGDVYKASMKNAGIVAIKIIDLESEQ